LVKEVLVGMKRRTFVKSSMALASSALIGRASWAAERRWDFVIVGAGTAGVPAAIAASKRGAHVLLIDSAEAVGGTMHIANGQVSAAGSRLLRLSNGLADPGIVRDTVDNAADTVNWLLDGGLQPMSGHPVTGAAPGRDGYSVRRYLWDEKEGPAILAVALKSLQPELASGRVVTQLNTRVTGLLASDSGAIEGVRAGVAGESLTFRGRHVLLTSGGYAMNPGLFEMLVGQPAYATGSYPHSLGDGLRLATSVGGWLRGQNLHRAGTGSILTTDEFGAKVYARFNTVPQERQPWEIWVNKLGQRFIREDEPLVNTRASALVDQPALRYAIVFDDAIFRSAPLGIKDWTRSRMLEHFNAHPMFSRAGTLEELAVMAKVDPAGLVATVSAYNESVASGQDRLGRSHMPAPIIEPPYYAITHLGSSATSSTGVVVDRERRVIRGDGNPIPNLYAAGEILGSGATLGNTFCPGMMLTPALALGRLLGERLPLA
jgi:fumarate reductase flavoprotein subunit